MAERELRSSYAHAALAGGVAAAAIASVLTLESCAEYAPRRIRPENWAQPVADLTIKNFHKVTETLYRGAQPDAEGMRRLHKMGIRTVINLRQYHSDDDEIGELPLKAVRIRMSAWRVRDDQVVRFLKAVTAPGHQPVYVHCRRGSDRTGLMLAVYRVVVEGWSRAAAAEEMRHGGYSAAEIFGKLQKYLAKMDIRALRRQAGLEAGVEKVGP